MLPCFQEDLYLVSYFTGNNTLLGGKGLVLRVSNWILPYLWKEKEKEKMKKVVIGWDFQDNQSEGGGKKKSIPKLKKANA